MPDGGRLAGRRALVTGGSSGIGLAVAELFVIEGAQVVIASRDAVRGGEAASATAGIEYVQADISDLESVEHLVAAAREQMGGGVDILVNNAGAFPVGPVNEPNESDYQLAFDVNVKGPYLLTALIAQQMIDEERPGKIVNITTMAASVGIPGIGIYSASKAALASLTQTWAAELGPQGINVNAVAPGPVMTPMTMGIQEAQDEFAGKSPARRKGTSADIASAVLFLASDESSYVHGEQLMVDGGYVAV
jgi:NAD(P)-dependent dehydrogenase (short-subunit alcohol dehydrogenase family)